jgi:hypothetical protein
MVSGGGGGGANGAFFAQPAIAIINTMAHSFPEWFFICTSFLFRKQHAILLRRSSLFGASTGLFGASTGISIGYDVVREFWPDISRKLHLQKDPAPVGISEK